MILRTLALNFVARTTNLTKGFNKVRRDVSSFVSVVTGSAARLSAIGAALGLALSGSAVVGAVKNQSSLVDALAKTSDQLGIATQDLAAFQLQADLAGVSTEQFSAGIRKMVRSISDAAEGSKSARAAFSAIGLDPRRLQSQSVKNAYLDIADAISAVTSAQKRLDISSRLFGRGGQSMISLMLDGRAGFSKAAKDASAFGLAITRIDAAKVEQANDALTRAGAVISGIARLAAVKFAPIIETAADLFTKWASTGTNAADVVNAAFNATIGTLKIVGGTIQALADLNQRLLVTFLGVRNAVAWLGGGSSVEMQNELSRAIIQLESMEKAPRFSNVMDGLVEIANKNSTKTASETAAKNSGLEVQEDSNSILREISRDIKTIAAQGNNTVDF